MEHFGTALARFQYVADDVGVGLDEVDERIEMRAKGLGVMAVHFCFQLNEDMIRIA